MYLGHGLGATPVSVAGLPPGTYVNDPSRPPGSGSGTPGDPYVVNTTDYPPGVSQNQPPPASGSGGAPTPAGSAGGGGGGGTVTCTNVCNYADGSTDTEVVVRTGDCNGGLVSVTKPCPDEGFVGYQGDTGAGGGDGGGATPAAAGASPITAAHSAVSSVAAQAGIPTWAVYVGLGLLAYMVIR
jgi:hypothetical protein